MKIDPPSFTKWILIGAAFFIMAAVLGLPLAAIFIYAFREGWPAYVQAISSPDTVSAIRLTLLAVAVAVPCNTLFGILAAWALVKHEFRGKQILISMLDIPFSISPVIAGLALILVYGKGGWIGQWLSAHGMPVIFAPAGIVLATAFVTLPLVARELIPLMQAQGTVEEEAATLLGAGGLKTFWRITLPNIKWGLVYGVVLATARALGEFGAVQVVSGRIRGQTNTLTLHVEVLYNEYQLPAAFAVASLLTFVTIAALAVKVFIERREEIRRSSPHLGRTAGNGGKERHDGN